jgi:heat shock protein HtpX
MTEALLTNLSEERVRGVLAHELALIKNHDVLVSSIAAMIVAAISAIANVLQLSFLFGGDEEDGPLGWLGSLAAMIPAPLWRHAPAAGSVPPREYLADATAARMLGTGRPLADALQTISHGHTQHSLSTR